MAQKKTRIPEILRRNEAQILQDWLNEQMDGVGGARSLLKEGDLRQECSEFLSLLLQAIGKDELDPNAASFSELRNLISRISRERTLKGFSPVQTAMFVFSLKKPLFRSLRNELSGNAQDLMDEVWTATELLDKLGLYSTESYQKAREEVIARQQQELLELSTPVIKLWDGILALPLIGTLDSARTQIVMESLLQKITETGANVAIIDITGVPTVDTLVAQHLLKTVSAARLMGADCIISGIRPQIAQTIVHLGVELGDVITKANLADAFSLAMDRSGMAMVRKSRLKAQS